MRNTYKKEALQLLNGCHKNYIVIAIGYLDALEELEELEATNELLRTELLSLLELYSKQRHELRALRASKLPSGFTFFFGYFRSVVGDLLRRLHNLYSRLWEFKQSDKTRETYRNIP